MTDASQNIPFESSNELEGKVVIPSMKSLYVEMYRGDLKLASGTAFLAANDRDGHCALITNRHNVTGRDQDSGQSLHSRGAEPDAIVIHFHKALAFGEWKQIRLPLFRPDGSPFWIEHPRFGASADLVAMNLTWGGDVTRFPYYMNLELDRPGLLVDPAEPVSVIGFPFGLSSFGRFPIWTTGFLAQELQLIRPENPVFLIDCRSRQGQSGSAVVAYRTSNFRTRSEDGRARITLNGPPIWEFLGIYAGRINAQSDLGRVWHASAIQEVLNAAADDYKRRSD